VQNFFLVYSKFAVMMTGDQSIAYLTYLMKPISKVLFSQAYETIAKMLLAIHWLFFDFSVTNLVCLKL